MEEFYASFRLNGSKVICVGSIRPTEADAMSDTPFCDGFGHYVFLADEGDPKGDIQVLARAVSEEAAAALVNALRQVHA